MVKPDGIQRSLVGEIVSRYERIGLKLVAAKMLVPTPERVEEHYTLDPSWKRKVGEKAIEGYERKGMEPPSRNPEEIAERVVDGLKKYLTSGPVLAMVWQGAHAVGIVRKVTGSTEPLSSDVGTIRGDYVLDSYQMSDQDGRAVRNLVHASGSPEEAEQEISLWFSPEEVQAYRLIGERILYEKDIRDLLA